MRWKDIKKLNSDQILLLFFLMINHIGLRLADKLLLVKCPHSKHYRSFKVYYPSLGYCYCNLDGNESWMCSSFLNRRYSVTRMVGNVPRGTMCIRTNIIDTSTQQWQSYESCCNKIRLRVRKVVYLIIHILA